MTGPDPAAGHLRPLDGVRAVAAVAVLLTHVGFLTGTVTPSLAGAVTARLDIGVALFFGLSGFLMLRPWIATAVGDRDRAPRLGSYSVKRATRILPAYWVAATVVLLLEAARVFRPDLSSTLRVDPTSVLQHVLVLQGFSGSYFSTFSQTWSLTTEITFYVVVPALGTGLVRWCRRHGDRTTRLRSVRRACLAFVVVGLAVTVYCATDLPGSSPALARSVLGHAAWFAAGAWVCAETMARPAGPSSGRTPEERLALAAVLLLLAASPLGGRLLFSQGAAWQAGVRELLYALVAVLVVGAACRRSPTSPALRVLSSRVAVWVGIRSYALFLWHLPIAFGIMTLLRLDLFEGSFVVVALLTLAVSLVVADLSWRLVEQPCLAASGRWVQRRRHQGEQEQAAGLGHGRHD